MKKKSGKANIKFRYNIMTVLTYVIGIVLLAQLFNLQIVHGAEYREQSNTRLTRETTLEAARGSILDRTGNVLASSDMKFALELYKTKIDDETLNNSILSIIQVLEKYGISYDDDFPVTINPFQYTIEGETLANWKKTYDLDENASAEEAFYDFKERYEISNEDLTEARKIMSIRYQITTEGYSSTKALTIADDIPREAVAEFSENSDKYPGTNIVVEPIREYTQGTLAAHVIGYASKISSEEYEQRKDTYSQNDIIGKTGVESVFEEYLKGKNGTKQIDMSVDGTITAEYTAEEAVEGSDVVLTIDAELQRVAEEVLASNLQKIQSGGFGRAYAATASSCVVMDVRTGDILAMANVPTYNPQDFVGGISTENWNKYINDSAKPLVNKAIQNSYSPGSIFKMVTAIAGLETGAINSNTRINDTGVYNKYPDSPKNCWYYTDYHRGHGWLNVSQAIQKSCNYFFYETADRIGIDVLDQYATYFGLGKKTGVELLGETDGVLASRESKSKLHPDSQNWNPGDTLNAGIGQGDNEFSPLQMAKYISMLANGGKNVDVSIVKTIRNADGSEVSKDDINNFVNQKLGLEAESTENLNINPQNLQVILEGMRSVTDEQGTASSVFQNFEISVGGKTGSAEAPGNKVNAWFAGFAPFENPEIAVVVMVENGGHGYYAGEAVREIMREYFGMNTENVTESATAVPYTESFR